MPDTTIELRKFRWTLGERVGDGGFGQVCAATADEVEQPAVIKLVPKAPGAQRELLFVEIEGARNVIPVLDTGEDDVNYALAMWRAEKSLRQHLEQNGRLSENEAVAVLRNVAAALDDLDGQLVHRDLKPENVLYLNGFWCLADFGISRYAEATTAEDTRKYSMTAQYAAPEQWRWERTTGATDVYALGIMGFEMLVGYRPFLGPDFREQHLHEAPNTLDGVSGPLGAFITQCLNKDPGSRPSAADISRRLATMAGQTVRPGLAGLQQAHHEAALQQAETQRQMSEAESWFERRGRLFEDARRTLTAIGDELRSALVDAAPSIATVPQPGEQLVLELGSATLSLSEPRELQGLQEQHRMPFTVIAFAELSLLAPAATATAVARTPCGTATLKRRTASPGTSSRSWATLGSLSRPQSPRSRSSGGGRRCPPPRRRNHTTGLGPDKAHPQRHRGVRRPMGPVDGQRLPGAVGSSQPASRAPGA